jgi:hypothetical protein
MIETGYGKHSDQVQKDGRPYHRPIPANKKHAKASQVQQHKRKHPDELHLIRFGPDGGEIVVAIVSVKPLNQ